MWRVGRALAGTGDWSRRMGHLGRRIRDRNWQATSEELSTLWKTQILLRLLPAIPARILGLNIVLGMVCGLLAVAFHGGLQASSALVGRILQSLPSFASFVMLLVLPAIGAWIAGVILVRSGLPAAGSGIPQVKAAIHHRIEYPGIPTGITKFLLCLLQIGGGASLGREGPTVQISASFVPRFLRVFALPVAYLDRFVPVAAAAGIAAAFNTPMAAVTFTMEELMGTSSPTALTGLVLAAAVAAIEEKLLLGGYPLFHVPSWGFGGLASLPSFLLLGVCGGFSGVLFHRGLLAARIRFRSIRMGVPARMALGGLGAGLAACIAWWFVGSMGIAGPGYALLDASLGQDLSLGEALALLPLKFAATISSYSSGGVGGIFSPVLAMGSLLGEVVGYVQGFFPWKDSTPVGAFALVGMGTLFASVIQAPITSVLIIFELTGNYGLVIPLMLSNMASFLVAKRMNPVPVYDALLLQDGIELRAEEDGHRTTVGDLCTRDVAVVAGDSRVERCLLESPSGRWIVATDKGRLVGSLDSASLKGSETGPVADFIGGIASLREEDLAIHALSLMSQEKIPWLPVVKRDGSVVGIFEAKEALSLLSRFAAEKAARI